jgi:hypothetical protein
LLPLPLNLRSDGASTLTTPHRSSKEFSLLVITVDIVPGGLQPLRRTLASMCVSNLSNLADVSDYRVDLLESANTLAGTPARIGSCEVKGHLRRQSVWALVAKAAEAALGAETDPM